MRKQSRVGAWLVLAVHCATLPAAAQENPSAPARAEVASTDSDQTDNKNRALSGRRVVTSEELGLVMVRVRLRSLSPHRHFIVKTRQHALLAECYGRCELSLPSGRYFVEIPAREGDARGIANLIAETDVDYEIEDADRDAAETGLAMAIAGMVMIPGGALIAVLGSGCLIDCQPPSAAEQVAIWGGIVTSLSGMVLTPVGWVQFARNRRPKVVPSGWQWGVGPAPSGALVGLTRNF